MDKKGFDDPGGWGWIIIGGRVIIGLVLVLIFLPKGINYFNNTIS